MISPCVDLQSVPSLGLLATDATGVGAVQVDLAVPLHEGGVGHGLATGEAAPARVLQPLHHRGQHRVQVWAGRLRGPEAQLRPARTNFLLQVYFFLKIFNATSHSIQFTGTLLGC